MLDFMGERFMFQNLEIVKVSNNPIMFVFCGQTSHSETPYVVNIVKEAVKNGYDCCVINYRGLAGARLYTPKLFTFMSFQDFEEAIFYVQ